MMNMILVGQPLYTKDGRSIGNARVTGAFDQGELRCYGIVTDFGNTAKLTAREIQSAFYLHRFHDDEQLPNIEHLPNDTRHLHLTQCHGMNVLKMVNVDGIQTQLSDDGGTMIFKIPSERWSEVSKALCIPDTV